MYKCGFKFEVVKNGIVGVIDGVSTAKVYSVAFYKDGEMYLRADVCEGTIRENLRSGYYREIVQQEANERQA